MAFQPGAFQWGPLNQLWYSTTAPASASEGPFKVGDWVILTNPTASNPVIYVCTVAGTGATATFKTISLSS